MAVANITWQPVPGSLSTLVEYKLSSNSTWIQPASPTNPTIFNTYPLTITSNVYYDVRLTTIGSMCTPKSVTFQIISVGSSCCPATYTLSADGTYCFKNIITAATPPSSPENTVAKNLNTYTVWGSLIYDLGFNPASGVGTFTQIPYTNAFWVNGAGYPSGAGANTSNGPLNRSGLWATTETSNQDVGFTVCVTLPNDGIYYVGIGVDNYALINIDGVNVLTMNPTAIGNYLNANGYPGVGGINADLASFRFWHIYPIALTAGNHIIEVIGHNVAVPASLGTEIYNATSGDLQAATSYGALGAKLIFSTKDYIGMPVQVGSGGTGYTCAPGTGSLVLCDGPAYCLRQLTTATIPC